MHKDIVESPSPRRAGYARVSTVADLSKHPQVRRAEIAGVNGPISVPALAASFGGVPGKLGKVPMLGEHTEIVRQEFAS